MKYFYNYLNINSAKEYFEALENNFVCINYPTYLVNEIRKSIDELNDNSMTREYGYARFLYANYKNKEELYRAFGTIKKLSEVNHIPSIHLYGKMLLAGKVVKNEKEAIECFKKASKKNFALSIYELGKTYYYGIGVKQNIQKGINLINKASKKKSSGAMVFLAYLFINGEHGIKKDYQKALKYLNKAMCMNDPDSYYFLAQMYHKGLGVNADINEAFKYYDLAASYEIVEAILICGHLLIANKASEDDINKAVSYYEKAAYLKSAEGMYFYASHLLTGKGCTKNVAEGMKLMKQAADLGNETAIQIINGKKGK